jgi:hypothetical protein
MAHPRIRFYSSKKWATTDWFDCGSNGAIQVIQRWLLVRAPDPFQRSVLPTVGHQPDYVLRRALQELLGRPA